MDNLLISYFKLNTSILVTPSSDFYFPPKMHLLSRVLPNTQADLWDNHAFLCTAMKLGRLVECDPRIIFRNEAILNYDHSANALIWDTILYQSIGTVDINLVPCSS